MGNVEMKILITDDNKLFTEILSDYISLYNNIGIEVVGIAGDGFEALELIRKKQPDIVLLDIHMPLLDGIGVLKQIKGMQMKKEPLFIIMTASGQDSLVREAVYLGAVYYLEKPFDMTLLMTKLMELQTTFK